MGSKIRALSDKKFNLILFILVTVASVFYVFYLHKELDGGFVAGADWNVPATKQQYERALEIFTSTWSDSWYLGLRNSTHTNLWYIVFTYILSRIFTDLTYIPLIVIALIQALALLTTFHFLRDIGVSRLGGLAGGIFLATSPIMFNYLIMGWIYVLFAFSFLNLSLIFIKKSLETQRLSFSAVAGIFFGLSLAQSQAILWLPLVVTTYVLFGNFTFVCLKRKLLSLLIYAGVGLLINAPTITDLVFYPNPALLNPKILTSGGSLGASVYATPVNIIRLFGSNFNKPYENTQNTGGEVFLTFLLPVLIGLYLIDKNTQSTNKHVPFLMLFFTSMLSLFLDSNRELLKIIPGGAVFRDTARFSFVSTFAGTALLGLATDVFKNRRGLIKIVGVFATMLLLYTTVKPWLEGELTKQPMQTGADIRLRGIKYPASYNEVETLLKSDAGNYRVLYLPPGGMMKMKNNSLFSESYRELGDVYAGYSPLPGGFYINDRVLGVSADLMNSMYRQLKTGNQIENLDSTLRESSTKYVVLRHSAFFPQQGTLLRYVGTRAKSIYSSPDISVYEMNETYPIVYTNGTGREGGWGKLNATELLPKKLSPHEYALTLRSSRDEVKIRFTESYDNYWTLKVKGVSEKTGYDKYIEHNVSGDYSNGWSINLMKICEIDGACKDVGGGSKKLELTILHNPASISTVMYILSTMVLVTITGFTIKRKISNAHE